MSDEAKPPPAADAPVTSKRGGGTGFGRPLKLTQELIATFVQILQGTSTPIATMAEAAGISRTSFFKWMAKGESAKSGIYRDLFVAITQARAEGTQNTLAQIRSLSLATKDWRGMAWELERTRPKEFAPRIRVHVEEELTVLWNLLKHEFEKEPAVWERIARVIAGEVSPEDPETPES